MSYRAALDTVDKGGNRNLPHDSTAEPRSNHLDLDSLDVSVMMSDMGDLEGDDEELELDLDVEDEEDEGEDVEVEDEEEVEENTTSDDDTLEEITKAVVARLRSLK